MENLRGEGLVKTGVYTIPDRLLTISGTTGILTGTMVVRFVSLVG